jgi:hypothetical protein
MWSLELIREMRSRNTCRCQVVAKEKTEGDWVAHSPWEALNANSRTLGRLDF